MSNTVTFEIENLSTVEMLAHIAWLNARDKTAEIEQEKDISKIIERIREDATHSLQDAVELVNQKDYASTRNDLGDSEIGLKSKNHKSNDQKSGSGSSGNNEGSSGASGKGGEEKSVKDAENPTDIYQMGLAFFKSGQVEEYLSNESNELPIPILDEVTKLKIEEAKLKALEKNQDNIVSNLAREVEVQKNIENIAVIGQKKVEDIINNIDNLQNDENQRKI